MLSPVEEIKSRLDVVEVIQGYIRLQKAGMNYKANCPFHGEKTPSFYVSPTRQMWHCFGCGKGGDMFTFVMEMEGQDFPEVLRVLAGKAGVALTREDPALRSERNRLYEANEEAVAIFQTALARTPAVGAYLKKRGLTDATIREFRVGFAPQSWNFLLQSLARKGFRTPEVEKAGLVIRSQDGSSWYDRFRGRIMFPITDANSRVVGFGGRIFEATSDRRPASAEPALPAGQAGHPAGGATAARQATSQSSPEQGAKYINTPQTIIYDKSRALYAFDKGKQEIRAKDSVIVVEGYMDCVMAHQAGTKNTIAVSGTALTSRQLQTLRRLCSRMISSFDADAAGESATRRSLALASEFDFERRIARIPSGKDPADAIVENPQAWLDAVEQAKPVVEFYMAKAFGDFDPRTAEGKKSISGMVLPFLAELADEIQKAHWAGELARRLDVPEAAILREIQRSKVARQIGGASVDADSRSIGYAHEEKEDAPVQRRQLLEERFLALLAMMDEQARRAAFVDTRISFSVVRNSEILTALTSAGAIKISPEVASGLHVLKFKGEVLAGELTNPGDEFRICKRELERECIRDELNDLGRRIKFQEQQGDKASVASLLKRFQELSLLMHSK